MWTYALNGLIVILLSLEVWKCGNMQLNGLIVNVLIKLGSLERWKSGNVEICVERFNR